MLFNKTNKHYITVSTNDTSSTIYRYLYSSKLISFPNHTIYSSEILGKNKCALPLDTCIKP